MMQITAPVSAIWLSCNDMPTPTLCNLVQLQIHVVRQEKWLPCNCCISTLNSTLFWAPYPIWSLKNASVLKVYFVHSASFNNLRIWNLKDFTYCQYSWSMSPLKKWCEHSLKAYPWQVHEAYADYCRRSFHNSIFYFKISEKNHACI